MYKITYFIVFTLFLLECTAQDPHVLKIEQSKKTKTVYGLIIGVAHYPDIHPPLEYADADAELFEQFLRSPAGGNAEEKNILKIINESAKLGNIISSIRDWLKNRPYKPGDRLYVYLAGHGDAVDSIDKEFYFLAYNCSIGNDGAKNNYFSGGALEINMLQNRLKKIADQGIEVFLIMDACRTNELTNAQVNVFNPNSDNEIVFLSAQPGASSLESKKYGGGHGLFTWYLIDGLSGTAASNKKKSISLLDLDNYVGTNVVLTNPKQKPAFLTTQARSRYDPLFEVNESYYKSWLKEKAKILNSKQDIESRDVEINRGIQLTSPIQIPKHALYNLILFQLSENNFERAKGYYDDLKADFPDDSLEDDARSKIIAETIDLAQLKINFYLEGKYNLYNNLVSKGKDKGSASDRQKERAASLRPATLAHYLVEAKYLLDTTDVTDSALVKSLELKYNFLMALDSYQTQDETKYSPINFYQNSWGSNPLRGLEYCQEALQLEPRASFLYDCKGNLERIIRTPISESARKGARSKFNPESSFSEAIRLNPKWFSPYNSLGLLYQRDFNHSKSFYDLALKLHPTSEITIFNLGNLYLDFDKLDSSIYYFTKLVTLNPTIADAHYKLGYIYLDSLLNATSNHSAIIDSSIKYFLNVSKINKSILMGIELRYLFSQKTHPAVGYEQSELEQNTVQRTQFELQGLEDFEKGNLTKAEKNFKKAAIIDNTNSRMYFKLANVFIRKKMLDSVIYYFHLISESEDKNRVYSAKDITDYLLETKSKEVIKMVIEYYRSHPLEYCPFMELANAYSLLKQKALGLEYLEKAIIDGCWDKSKALYLQKTPEFKMLLKKYRKIMFPLYRKKMSK